MNPFLQNGLVESREENEANAIFNQKLGLFPRARPQGQQPGFFPGVRIPNPLAGLFRPDEAEREPFTGVQNLPLPGEPGHDPDPGFTVKAGPSTAIPLPSYDFGQGAAIPLPRRDHVDFFPPSGGYGRTMRATPESSVPSPDPGPAKASSFIDPKTGKLDYWAWLDAGAANLGKGGVLFEDDMPEAMEQGAVKAQQLGVVASGSPENKRMPDEETFEEKQAKFGYGSQNLAMNVAAKARGQQPGADAPGGQAGQTQPPAQAGTDQAGTPQPTTPAQPGQAPQTGGGAQPGQSTEANDPRILPEDMGPTPSFEEWQASPWGQAAMQGKKPNWGKYYPKADPGTPQGDPHAYNYPIVGTPPNTPEGRRMRELIEKYAAKYGVPVQLMFNKAQVESGWDQSQVNSIGARGLFQIIPDTAGRLRIDANDLEQNIEGATRLMADLLKQAKGDPFLAEIGFNGSPANIWSHMPLPLETYHHLQKVFPGQGKEYLLRRMPASVQLKLMNAMSYGQKR